MLGPMAAPVPITEEVSHEILKALKQRDIEYVAKQLVVGLDAGGRRARLAGGDDVAYDMFVGIPIHRVPEVIESSGLAVDGWIPVDKANLKTRFRGVYALGDVASTPNAKAGVFAEAAARVVADDIAATLSGGEARTAVRGRGPLLHRVRGREGRKGRSQLLRRAEADGPARGPLARARGEKGAFASSRRERWFGS